jgi:hypothetical protein
LLLLIAALVLIILLLVFLLQVRKETDDIDDLFKAKDYVRPCHDCCIKVLALPLIVESQNCYDLEADFTITDGSSAIIATNVFDVQVNFLNHSITVDGAVGSNVIVITNSTRVEFNTPRLFSVPQSYVTNARGIRIEPVFTALTSISDGIRINDAWISGFRIGIFAQRANVYITNPTIRAHRAQSTQLFGIFGQNNNYLAVLNGNINVSMSEPVTFDDGPIDRVFGIVGTVLSVPDSTTPELRHSAVRIEDTSIYAGSCIRLRGVLATVRNNHLFMDRKASLSAALELGESPSQRAAVIEGNTIDCEVPADEDGTGLGNTCVVFSNARSVIFRHNSIYGTITQMFGIYRGALLEVDVQGDQGYLASVFSPDRTFQKSLLIEDLTIQASDANTLAVHIKGDASPSSKAITLRNVLIHGGLVGVLMRNFSYGVTLDNVQVVDSVYGIAATDFAIGASVKNSDVFHSCLCYFADETTTAIGLYENRAISCIEAYRDDGVGNEFSVGSGTDGNNRELGSVGECELPSLFCIVEGDPDCLIKKRQEPSPVVKKRWETVGGAFNETVEM